MGNNTSNNSSIVACVFVAEVTFLLSHCLATIEECICRHTDRWVGFMRYAVEMGSDAMIYIPSFIKIGSGIQKFIGREGDSQTHRQQGYLISLFLFFQNKESRLIGILFMIPSREVAG
jgi:hypothetical protein